VIVAVTIMGVMQMAIDQVIYMIAVGHCFVSAVVAVLMCSIMACTIMTARAIRGIRCVDLKPVLIDVAIVERVQGGHRGGSQCVRCGQSLYGHRPHRADVCGFHELCVGLTSEL